MITTVTVNFTKLQINNFKKMTNSGYLKRVSKSTSRYFITLVLALKCLKLFTEMNKSNLRVLKLQYSVLKEIV